MMNKTILTESEISTKIETIISQHQNHTQHMYIDITGDLVSGTLLSQIMYWFAEDKGGKSKVRVFKNGYFWIAKRRDEWYDEIRISKRQFDVAIKFLSKNHFVFLEKHKFQSLPTLHIRPNYEKINSEIQKWKDIVRGGIVEGNVNKALRDAYESNMTQTRKVETKEEREGRKEDAENGNEQIVDSGRNLQNVNSRNEQIVNSQGNEQNVNSRIDKLGTPLTMTTNSDYFINDHLISEDTSIHAFNPSEKSEGLKEIHASCYHTKPVSAPKKKRVGYLKPGEFTADDLYKHLYQRSLRYCLHNGKDEYDARDFARVIHYFYMAYKNKTGHDHPFLNDGAFERVADAYFHPPEYIFDGDLTSVDNYAMMIDRFLETNFGERKKNEYGYGNEIETDPTISLFMSGEFREHIAMHLFEEP